ncbi:MAG: hypothetical protein PHY92_05625 [Alphaproteobacteria bacterium]|nr:hypothetical protein [Alphaproteobacteria bacterium]
MTYDQDDLLRLIHATRAASIWNRDTGPVYWYIAGIPGPFYVNTELLIGAEASGLLLDKITAILAQTADLAARSAQITEAVMAAYEENEVYQRLVATMAAAAKSQFPAGSFDLVSGGERRDWLFSIPFARACGIGHAFLFKNLSLYSPTAIKPGAKVLHVADLINNAASYLDLWLPALEKAGLECAGTLCVISRGNGLEKLAAKGLQAVSLNSIDLSFFEKSHASGLIDRATLDEVATHFASPKAWAEKYFVGHKSLRDLTKLDAKSFERVRSFADKDPWGLKAGHAAFFDALQTAIKERLKAA